MTTAPKFTVLLALALGATAAGCAADAPGNGNGNGSGSGSGSGSDDVAAPATPEGKYSLQSDFDIASNTPGKVGEVVNAFIDMTDSPDDPTKWVVDHAIAAMPSGTLKTLASSAAPLITGYLNDRILQVAPNFVAKMKDIGNKFGDVAKHFGTLETLEISKAGTAYAATHTVTGMHFTVDAVGMDFPFADSGMTNVVATNVAIGYDPTGKLTIGEHAVPLSYGKILRLALDKAIIPTVDGGASDLGTVLNDLVDCNQVGQAISDQVGFGSPGTYASACTAGLAAGADYIYKKINDLDGSALEFGIAGSAKALDTNHDSKLDSIQRGSWTGNLSYAGTPAPLSTATFFGGRM
jgi:hypothetical protein